MRNSPAMWLVQKKNRPEKILFLGTDNWIVLGAPWSVNIEKMWNITTNSSLFWKNCEEEDGEYR